MNAASNPNQSSIQHERALMTNNTTTSAISTNVVTVATGTAAGSSNSSSTTHNNNNNNITNGSLSDSLASTDGHRTPNVEQHLSKTNLYIRGLSPKANDQDLNKMCGKYGHILSTKAILDKNTRICRGYGFVEFSTPQEAELAVQGLKNDGIQAQMAKISALFSSHHHPNHHHHHHHINNSGSGSNNNNNPQQHNQNSSNNNPDPTNLYIANLPPNMSEQELENLLSTYGPVVSTRILRDQSTNIPRGVGFARMESRDKCEQIIEQLNGRPCKGWKEPLLVKFADGGNKKRHHHNSQHQHQHQHHNNHNQHHMAHQDDNRWRDSSNTSDLSSVSSFDPQGNISHSNHLTDLAIMSTLSYPRMQPGFPPVTPGAPYPTSLGPPNRGPQWIHPGGPGNPYAIPQQIIQAGGLGPSNQAAAAAALHYGHIPQLASQMQGLQIAHPGAPIGGYLPPQHQWSALWTHPIPQQPQTSMQLPAQPPQPPPQQQQQQQSPQSNSAQQQPSISQQQSQATDDKIQASMPL